MEKILLFKIISLFAFANLLYGNGGGYHYGVNFTGSVSPFTAEGTENVQILDEQLDIKLGVKFAKVSVVYQMKNITDKKVKVKFGFPVEDVVSNWNYEPIDKNNLEKIPEYTKNYRVIFNGKEIKHHYFHEPFGADAKKKLPPFKGSDILAKIKGWQVSEMKLKPNETITLQITYDSQYDEESYSVSDDSSTGPWLFRYRLSTGGIWQGPILKGKVTVSYNDQINPKDIRVDKPVNKFKKSGNSLTWEFENLEPTLADDITVQAIAGESEYGIYSENGASNGNLSYLKLDQKWFLKHVKYSVTSSSTLPNEGNIKYSAENLKALWDEVWSEGAKGSGIGESITIKPKKASIISSLSIQNGHIKSERLFGLNNRVKQLDILINKKHKSTITLADLAAQKRYQLNYDKPISSIKLTIRSVYRGSKYDDTCIGSIVLVEPLKTEPKRYGAR